MRTLFFTFVLSLLGISTNFVQAQSNHSTKTVQKSSNIAVSVSESDSNYQFKAKYDNEYDEVIKELLVNRFGEESITEKNGWLSWIFSDSAKDEVYSIELTSGKVRIQLNKNLADRQLQQQIKNTGEEISEILSSK